MYSTPDADLPIEPAGEQNEPGVTFASTEGTLGIGIGVAVTLGIKTELAGPVGESKGPTVSHRAIELCSCSCRYPIALALGFLQDYLPTCH